jgi:hypothetical protein
MTTYTEAGVELGLVIAVIVTVALCCTGTVVASCCYHRRTRPREDSGESLV